MESKFSGMLVKGNGNDNAVQKDLVYLKIKAALPIGQAKEFRIVDGHKTRQLFRGKTPECMSFDGEVGKVVASGYKEERLCNECPYKKGVGEGDDKVKCQYKFVLHIEDPDPEKEQRLSIGYGAHVSFSEYAEALFKEGIDVPDVKTKITRLENPNGPGNVYRFEKGALLKLQKSDAEEKFLSDMLKHASENGPIEFDYAMTVIMKTKELAGITEEKAKALLNTIAKDGMIGA